MKKLDYIAILSLCAVVAAVWCIANHKTCLSSWNEPTEYYGDAYVSIGYSRAVAQGDWTIFGVRKASRLNWPVGADWQNFPSFEKVPTFVLGAIIRYSNIAFAGNVGLLAARLTAAVGFLAAAYFILRCSRWWAWVGGAAFATLYYFDYRGLDHLLLNFTWTVPLVVAASWAPLRPRWLLIIGLLVGASNPYWVLGALILAVVCRQTIQSRIALVLGLALGFILSNLVTILWATKLALLRNYNEAERFALKPVELLLPPAGGLFNVSAHYYNSCFSCWRGEMFSSYLGIVGLIGLGVVIYDWLLSRRGGLQFTQVCSITICSSIGGLTCLMSLCGLTMFRAANRLSEFIAAIALLYLAVRLSQLHLSRKWQAVIGVLLALAAFTESLACPREHLGAQEAQKYAQDAEFGKKLDGMFGGQALYCIPPMYFPDDVRWPRVEPYSHLRPWLHTTNVSFSFGQATNQLSGFDQEVERCLMTNAVPWMQIAERGYGGVIFVRQMLPDNMDGLLKTVQPALVSPDFAVLAFSPSNRKEKGKR